VTKDRSKEAIINVLSLVAFWKYKADVVVLVNPMV
jgi:hypothetical protein